jgi:hypothetical protein
VVEGAVADPAVVKVIEHAMIVGTKATISKLVLRKAKERIEIFPAARE